eukprot:TRINITY_DN4376_c0_g1_i1.p1 TRINITY_DN4376_c0_g1~~TRINITY_DN4376_c0_g1_i1.p1  ORF type:complete len:190 (-),score=52.61 TRINITY_DN4376_c0_g1_i1:27-596(-)
MASQTTILKKKIEEQLVRLLQQLQDLQDERDSLDESEYEEMYNDTVQQLSEFRDQLNKMVSGDMTLVSEFGSVQLAIQAAVSKAFQTPEVIKLFAKKEPGQLRNRLAGLQRDVKLGKVSQSAYQQQAIEILTALKKLGETVTPEEQNYLSSHMTQQMKNFESATNASIGQDTQEKLRNLAAKKIQNAQN